MSQEKSCYVLELSVDPGGSRWAELHTYTETQYLKLILQAFCANDRNMAAYNAAQSGSTLGIWVIQRGVVQKFIDLHSFISLGIEDFGQVRLDDDARLDAIFEKLDLNDTFQFFDAVRITLDWDGIDQQLPTLEPPLLQRGESLKVVGIPEGVDTYLRQIGEISIGSLDYESGDELEVPFDLDEDENEAKEAS